MTDGNVTNEKYLPYIQNQFDQNKKLNSVTESEPYKMSNFSIDFIGSNDPSESRFLCCICQIELHEPYITCAECGSNSHRKNDDEVNIAHRSCLRCFAMGAETKTHSNTHSYIITHDNVKVFTKSNWSAREEKKLLELLIRCGVGNWTDISRAIGSRSESECRDHYLQYYFDGIFNKACGLTRMPYSPIRIPYLYRPNTNDPPRYLTNVVQSNSLAGYRYARSDFDTHFDSSAESVISNLHSIDDWGDDFKDVSEHLNCAMVSAYNSRLKERHRRYKVMREHGLIAPNRLRSWLAKYNEALNLKKNDKQTSTGRFIAFLQLTSGLKFDAIVEGLQYQQDLHKFLLRLYELRINGIASYNGGRVFQKLRSQRMSQTRIKPTTTWEWKHLVQNGSEIALSGADKIIKHCMDLNQLPQKRKSTPLNIVGLPNYDKLTKDEQELCSRVRLIPDAYLTYKKLLIAENAKIGYLRLADARRLIKIDVNKTRVMYDFFFEQGYVNKPFDKQ